MFVYQTGGSPLFGQTATLKIYKSLSQLSGSFTLNHLPNGGITHWGIQHILTTQNLPYFI